MASNSVKQGELRKLNVAAATVVKTGPGRVARVVVNTAGSTAGTINDCQTTGAAAAANLIAAIPNTANAVIYLDFPYTDGLVIVTGTGQVVSVSYT